MTDRESEERIQTNCYVWFHNSFPEYRGLLCYNLNNSKNKIDGARNKALGLQAGRSDMVLYWAGKAYFLEAKTPTGTQQPIQKRWEETVTKNGFPYFIFRSLEEFKEIVLHIVK